MKLLKSFFSFAFPLVVMLITFSVYLVVNKVVNNYKNSITNDYSIVVIANTPLVTIDELAGIPVKDIKILSREKIIKGLQSNLSDSSKELLTNKLPYFYNIFLDEFPTSSKLEQIRKELTVISNVKRVETFSKNHNQVYSILILMQYIVMIFFVVVLIMSFLILAKQMKIWFFEHSERLDIIQLHGGSLFYGSMPILKVMILSAFFASMAVSGLMFFTIENLRLIIQPEIVSLIPKVFDLEIELLKIVALSFFMPLVTFFGLLIRYKFN